ncbi:T9SS type B sorting domain-containing protein [Williamwhitmania taraxaci]|uniref:C-terminal domain of CHU protein family protein n=1 Tax=Williamwhitmania taraxaci TaxID=1640674 RepID=A0A1G6QW59_9BACT|nr:gliding motility-associated C-terminal domain-containing protein [Williamwhitmania taraxaci]SDC96620.1 C-terminal domain of CHU protein family protein [Williamwhitmania taraxaci]
MWHNITETSGTISPKYQLIVPGEYYAFSASPENINLHYTCPNKENLLQLTIPAMNDDQGTVVLTDTLGERVDEVTYTDKMHYALLASTEGVSLERVNPDMPSDKASSWQSASQLSGFATPTGKNSTYRDFEEVGSRVTIDPELFSPDGDGYHDVTYIRMKLPEPGWNATITIYDSKGHEVRKLLNNALIDVNGEIAWNGLTNDNQLAEMGIYVVLVEIFHLNGEVRKEKKVVVVGGRL